MKTALTTPGFLLSLCLCFATTSFTLAQNKKNEKVSVQSTTIEKLISSRSFIFRAQFTTPSGARQIQQLSYGYLLKVSGDTVTAYLPYYGESHAPTISGENNGIDFTSVSNDFKTEIRKKGGWDITIILKDYDDVEKVFLTVFENGKTSVQVLSKNRSPISYDGYVESPNKK